MTTLDFDKLFDEHLGSYGRYQKLVTTLYVISNVATGLFVEELVFVTCEPEKVLFTTQHMTNVSRRSVSGLDTEEMVNEYYQIRRMLSEMEFKWGYFTLL